MYQFFSFLCVFCLLVFFSVVLYIVFLSLYIYGDQNKTLAAAAVAVAAVAAAAAVAAVGGIRALLPTTTTA